MAIKVVRELATRFRVVVDKQSVQKSLAAMRKVAKAAKKTGAATKEAFSGKGKQILALGGTAAAAGGAIAVFSERMRAMGDDLGKASILTGLTTDALQELGFVAERSGISTEQMHGSIVALREVLAQARRGQISAELGRALSNMGLNARTAGLDMELVIDRLADYVSGIDDAGERLDVLRQFGLPAEAVKVWSQSSGAIRALRVEARQLGGVFSERLIKRLERYTDEQTRLQFAIKGVEEGVIDKILFPMRRLNNTFLELFRDSQGILTELFGSTAQQLIEEFGGTVAGLGERIKQLKDTKGLSPNEIKGLALLSLALSDPKAGIIGALIFAVGDLIFGITELVRGKENPLSFTARAISSLLADLKEFFRKTFSFDAIFEEMKEKKTDLINFLKEVLTDAMPDSLKRFMGALGNLPGGVEKASFAPLGAGSGRNITINLSVDASGGAGATQLASTISRAVVGGIRRAEHQNAAATLSPGVAI